MTKARWKENEAKKRWTQRPYDETHMIEVFFYTQAATLVLACSRPDEKQFE